MIWLIDRQFQTCKTPYPWIKRKQISLVRSEILVKGRPVYTAKQIETKKKVKQKINETQKTKAKQNQTKKLSCISLSHLYDVLKKLSSK